VGAWKTFAGFFGRRLRVASGRELVEGVAEDLEPDGALRLRTDGGAVVRVVAGEILGHAQA
jgi:BirA family biotin operon repressor/biotin-[acetyl-CoA-carboxylase] ligase